ncbi:hypothetical protein ACFL0P_07775 [Candidatus Omnitrophota bacterium]
MKVFLFGIIIGLASGLVFAEEDFRYDAGETRDPFVPLVSEGGVYVSDANGISGIKDIRLEGIVWDDATGSAAIINGEIVREEQMVGALKVLRIEIDSVVFDVDGEYVRVELNND